jgi:hypothetical protein
MGERVQDGKKQEWQKCPAGTRQTDSKNWGLVWRNKKKISQIIKDYFHLPFFLLIILWPPLLSSSNTWDDGRHFKYITRVFIKAISLRLGGSLFLNLTNRK